MQRRMEVALLLLLGAVVGAQAWGTEISASVSLFRAVEYEEVEYLNGRLATRCEHMVDNAARIGSSRVNFVISHFFVDKNYDLMPDYYCYKPNATEVCLQFTDGYIAQWTAALTKCLQYTVKTGFKGIAITPHLDDGAGGGQWRNAMLFNPLVKYGAYSYTDIMLLPLATALAAVMTEDLTVWFALQGEMSKMVTKFPQQHEKLLPYLKSVVTGNNSDLAPFVRMGVSTNYNKLCGMIECYPPDVKNPAAYNAAAVKSLYDAVDFIGLSSYPGFNGVDLSGMESATSQLAWELKMFGVDLVDLINVKGKELIFSEFGVGGGASGGGDKPATTVSEASNMPYFGVFGSYTRKLDPWRNYLPDTVISGTHQYVEDWYRAASLWLSRKGGPTLRVDAVFMWNLNSWDVVGIHPQSTNKEGSYRNEVVTAVIKAHNLKLRGLTAVDNPGTFAPY